MPSAVIIPDPFPEIKAASPLPEEIIPDPPFPEIIELPPEIIELPELI